METAEKGEEFVCILNLQEISMLIGTFLPLPVSAVLCCVDV